MTNTIKTPIITDTNNDYNNTLSTIQTIQKFIKTNITKIHLKNQHFPKRYNHITKKTVISRKKTINKYS